MSDIDTFGRIIDDGDVEQAVMALLQRWMDTYLNAVERLHGLDAGYTARPRSWIHKPELEKWPEDQLPSVIVISTGLDDRPVKDGRFRYRVPWLIGIAVVCSAGGPDPQTASRQMAYRYAATIRAIMVQKQSMDKALNGTVRGIDWIDGRNNELPDQPGDDRTIYASRQVFRLEVDDVLTEAAGPLDPEPPADPTVPPPDVPVVADADHVEFTINKEPIDG